MSVERVSYKIGDSELILETGKIGKQANGCVYAQYAGAGRFCAGAGDSEQVGACGFLCDGQQSGYCQYGSFGVHHGE